MCTFVSLNSTSRAGAAQYFFMRADTAFAPLVTSVCA